MADSNTDFISLAVPAEHYAEMVSHLGRLLAGQSPEDVGPVGRTPTGRIKTSDLPRVKWTVSDLQEVNTKIDGRPAVKALLDLLLARDGKPVPMSEYEAATPFNNRQLASALAGFTQMVGRDFSRSNWPFVVSWPDNGDGRAVYTIPDSLMERWRKV